MDLATDSSTPERPKSDRELNESIAVAAVREQFPALDCQIAKHIGSGWAVDVYLLDDRLVARFPRNADEAKGIDFDQGVLGFVTSRLASAFNVPTVVGRGKSGTYFPYDFLVCDYVRGVEADDVNAAVCEELAIDLGRALTRIHSLPVEDAIEAGLRQPEWDDYRGPLHFVHADFKHGNILVDPATGRLAGVIDWGNAAVGDAAQDFVSLVLWRGWRFMHRALAAYELPTDEGFLARIRSSAQSEALRWLTDSIRRGSDLQPHLSWVHNAFSRDRAV